MAKKQVMIFAIDDSEHSFYALNWTLDHFLFPAKSLFKLIVHHTRSLASAVSGFAGPGASDLISIVEDDLKKSSEEVINKALEVCRSKSVDDVEYEVVEGDARVAICESVQKHHASILVLGSHGYGAFKRAVLGSVSDYCAHHANCSVMIVKKPKTHAPKEHAPKEHSTKE